VPRDGRRGAAGRSLTGEERLLYARLVMLFAAAFVALGVALIVETAVAGGGVGFLIGALFVGLGVGRLYLLRRR
jgi:hypothetical protein